MTACRFGKAGFALVVTVTMMVLLLVLAVSMLTLATVSLRQSSQQDAQLMAQANARLALMLAIGELQASLGPDRAVTATSEILGTATTAVDKPNTTGVWESWSIFDSNGMPAYEQEKVDRFKRWLVSSTDAKGVESLDFATKPWAERTVELVGEGSLGTGCPDQAKVTAGLIPVISDREVEGAYAWHVSDESVKARVNSHRDPGINLTLADKRALLAGHRADPAVITTMGGEPLTVFPSDYTMDQFAIAEEVGSKILDLNQAELLEGAEGLIKPLRNDITPYSLGVMTNVRDGGLKQDLSSVFEMSDADTIRLPDEFAKPSSNTLYKSTHGVTADSDPKWSALASYYNAFRNLKTPDTNPTYELKEGSASLAPVPDRFHPAPVIAKVDTIFSLVARPLSEIHWLGGNTHAKYDYFLGLIFTPVVTLHNPYNCSVSFHKMKVSFDNIPVAFNFMLNQGSGFVSQSVQPGVFESINTMAYKNARNNKSFVMTIADWSDTDLLSSSQAVKGPITLKPGQTLVCGPIFPPGASLAKDSKLGHNTIGFDWENDLTEAVKAMPAFTPGIGFEVYGVTIAHCRSGAGYGSWATFCFLRDASYPEMPQSTTTDEFFLEFKLQRPSWYTDDNTYNRSYADTNFAVTAQLQATATGQLEDYAKLHFDYKDDNTLQDAIDDRVYRYPPTGSMIGSDMSAPSGATYSEMATYVHPFAIFSALARTTNGGVYETGMRSESGINSPDVNLLKDGRLAGKPFLFHNPSRTNFTLNLDTGKPGVQAYELNFQPFLSVGDYQDYMDVDNSNRVPALTGNKTSTGIKSGSYLELPSGPLQAIADFRRSNALTSSYLPHFVQPVANSLLHPLMSPDRVVMTAGQVSSVPFLDHSILANHALYDRFYFSTFATRGSSTPDVVFREFMEGQHPLAMQSFEPYLSGGRTVSEAGQELFENGRPRGDAYKTAAEYQMVRGPFNVNSTSVRAWMAVLGAMNRSDVYTLWAKSADLEAVSSAGVPILPMSMINGGPNPPTVLDASKIDNVRTNAWNGYRDLTNAELETLASRIVEEVRARGPFLSMAEFVNRRVGPRQTPPDPMTLSGALEAAITKAQINEPANATSADAFLNQEPVTETDVNDPDVYGYATPLATTGNPAAGAPGWINQGDLMRILEPSATLRGDTFVIRAYGDARDAKGNVTARAYAEAVVQRVPDYVDPADRSSVNVWAAQGGRPANLEFGRRMHVVSFRWLSNDEI